MHLKLGFVIGCKITTFLQILQYAFYWMVTTCQPPCQTIQNPPWLRHRPNPPKTIVLTIHSHYKKQVTSLPLVFFVFRTSFPYPLLKLLSLQRIGVIASYDINLSVMEDFAGFRQYNGCS